jgi:hypothetical protein
MNAIKRVYKRLLKDYEKLIPLVIKENQGLPAEDQCWIFDFEIDEELYPEIKAMFENDGFTCWEGDRTGRNCDSIDWLMRIVVEPNDHSNPLHKWD